MKKTWLEPHMGTMVEITLDGKNPIDYQETVERGFDFFRKIEKLYSPFINDSAIGRLKSGEKIEVVEKETEYFSEILQICNLAEIETRGFFTSQLPDKDGSFFFNPTGMIKGWTIQKVSELLSTLPETGFLINAGGDIQVGGTSPTLWNIGIYSPENSQFTHFLELESGAIATSGTYERGRHIYSPKTKNYPNFRKSLTVIGENILWSDIWATSLFIAEESYIQKFSEETGWKVISS